MTFVLALNDFLPYANLIQACNAAKKQITPHDVNTLRLLISQNYPDFTHYCLQEIPGQLRLIKSSPLSLPQKFILLPYPLDTGHSHYVHESSLRAFSSTGSEVAHLTKYNLKKNSDLIIANPGLRASLCPVWGITNPSTLMVQNVPAADMPRILRLRDNPLEPPEYFHTRTLYWSAAQGALFYTGLSNILPAHVFFPELYVAFFESGLVRLTTTDVTFGGIPLNLNQLFVLNRSL
jgi:hypothetical protein